MSAFTATERLHFGWRPGPLEATAWRQRVGTRPQIGDDSDADRRSDLVYGSSRPRINGFPLAILLGAAFWGGVAWLVA